MWLLEKIGVSIKNHTVIIRDNLAVLKNVAGKRVP